MPLVMNRFVIQPQSASRLFVRLKFPLAGSAKINSNVRSETTLGSRSFSFCSLFNSLSWSVSHAAAALAPAVVGLLGNLHLTDCINPGLSLSYKYINLAQLGDNLFGFMSLGTHN